MLALAVLLLVGQAAGAVGAVAGDDHEVAQADDEREMPQAADQRGIPQAGVDADRVVIQIDLRTDGSARWAVEYRVRLDSPEVTAGFEEARQELEQNRTAFAADFEQDMRAAATAAQERTGREMVIENFSVEATREQLPQEYGIVRYQFRWYGFAATDDRLQMGDALPGFFLDEASILVVSWPAETSLAEVRPEPDERRERSVVWSGGTEFGLSGPTVVLESESGSFGPDLRWDVGSNDEIVALAGIGLLLTTISAGIAGVVRYRRAPEAEEEAPEEDSEEAERTDEEDETPPEELLSNEERVLALLEENGGRIKQQAVVDEFGWSETKTSEVVGELREADEVEVYRLGRENVLALPEVGIEPSTDESGGDGG